MNQLIWSFKAELSHCQIWQHVSSQTIAQAYLVSGHEQKHYRINRNQRHLVNTLGVVQDNRLNRTYLLIERVPSRLSEIRILNEAQTLKVLFAIFKGFEELMPIYGLVRLCEACVCFDENGNVKIWVNPDLSSPHPILPVKDNCRHSMVPIMTEIISMIEKKCFNSSFLMSLVQKINLKQILDYRQAVDEVLRIAELLFIQINDRNCLSLYEKSYSKLPTPLSSEIPSEAKGQVENEKVGHYRKFSKYQKYEKYESGDNYHRNMVAQPVCQKRAPLQKMQREIPMNDVDMQLPLEIEQPLAHKSAPLSPRQNGENCATNPSPDKTKNYQNENNCIRNTIKMQADYNKKSTDKKPFVVHRVRELQCDDSFSRNLKLDDREIVVSGDFQTFGLLEDLNVKNQERSTKNEDSQVKEKKKKKSKAGLDLKELGREMERILNDQADNEIKKVSNEGSRKVEAQKENLGKGPNFFKRSDVKHSNKRVNEVQTSPLEAKFQNTGSTFEKHQSKQLLKIQDQLKSYTSSGSHSLTKQHINRLTGQKFGEPTNQVFGTVFKHAKKRSCFEGMPNNSNFSEGSTNSNTFSTLPSSGLGSTTEKFLTKHWQQSQVQQRNAINFRSCTQR